MLAEKDPLTSDCDDFGMMLLRELEIFVQEIFNLDEYDFIIPIEDEGLAILIPYLRKNIDLTKKVIPSRAIEEGIVDERKLNEKRLLLVDLSARSGRTLIAFNDLINENYNSLVDSFSFIGLKGVIENSRIPIKSKLIFDENYYFLSKQYLTKYIFENVFIKWSDPPLWRIQISSSDFRFFKDNISKLRNYYTINNGSFETYEILTIYNIGLNNDKWISKDIKLENNSKIRFRYEEKTECLEILPLVFPKIKTNIDLSVTEMLKKMEEFLPLDFSDLISHSKKIPSKEYFLYRWFSTIGSLLLFLDFLNQELLPNTFKTDDLFLSGPVPNLLHYSCNKEVFRIIEELTKKIILERKSINQPGLLEPNFIIENYSDELGKPKNYMKEYAEFIPQRAFEYHLGKLINQEKKSSGTMAELMMKEGWTFQEIKNKFDFLSNQELNYVLDLLIDEGVLRTRMKVSDGYLERSYAPAGESISRKLETIGMLLLDK